MGLLRDLSGIIGQVPPMQVNASFNSQSNDMQSCCTPTLSITTRHEQFTHNYFLQLATKNMVYFLNKLIDFKKFNCKLIKYLQYNLEPKAHLLMSYYSHSVSQSTDHLSAYTLQSCVLCGHINLLPTLSQTCCSRLFLRCLSQVLWHCHILVSLAVATVVVIYNADITFPQLSSN